MPRPQDQRDRAEVCREFVTRLRAEAARLGFARCGLTGADPLGGAVERRRAAWLAEGRAGAMGYLEREHPRRTHPQDLLEGAKTAIVVMAGYYDGEHEGRGEMRNAECGMRNQRQEEIRNSKFEIRNKSEIRNHNDKSFGDGEEEGESDPESDSAFRIPHSAFDPERGRPSPTGESSDSIAAPNSAFRIPHSAFGKVARYAWGRDYHLVLRERLEALAGWIAREAVAAGLVGEDEEIAFRPCVDSAPIDERALAVRAGLGFIGKNTLLLTPENGSWGLIGILLTNLELPPDAPLPRAPENSCSACRRCIEACPTGAIDAPYRVDARKCLSYLTIEQREEIPMEFARKMSGWVFGCDICQEVCPFNARPLDRVMPELAGGEGAGPFFGEAELGETPSGKAFLRRWKATPLERAGRKGMRRNLDALKAGET